MKHNAVQTELAVVEVFNLAWETQAVVAEKRHEATQWELPGTLTEAGRDKEVTLAEYYLGRGEYGKVAEIIKQRNARRVRVGVTLEGGAR